KTDKREEPLSIDYVVATERGSLKIIDIVTEGSSHTRGYRSQFKRILKKKGWDELIRLMKKKRDAS
ncbi:MAG: ABC transporter substrate-binding protein, partial [Polyangiaceae bacterium]